MNCETIRELFSEIFERTLRSPLKEEAERHIDECATCREELAAFESATRALQASSPGPASPEYVTSIMDAIDDEAWRGSVLIPWWRVATHAAAAIAGALILFLWLSWDGALDANGETVVGQAPVVSLGTHQAGTGSPRAVESQRPEPGSPVVHERVVEVVRYLPAPVVLPAERRRELQRGLAVFAEGFKALQLAAARPRVVPSLPPVEVPEPEPSAPTMVADSSLPESTASLPESTASLPESTASLPESTASLPESTASLPESTASLPESTASLPESTASLPESTAAVRRPAATAAAQPSAVRIRREGDRVSLKTRGPATEVIPTLIAHLEDDDAAVVELVERQLESIRADLGRDVRLTTPRKEKPARRVSFSGLFFGEDDDSEGASEDPHGEWSTWWEANAAEVAALSPERAF